MLLRERAAQKKSAAARSEWRSAAALRALDMMLADMPLRAFTTLHAAMPCRQRLFTMRARMHHAYARYAAMSVFVMRSEPRRCRAAAAAMSPCRHELRHAARR